MSPKYFYVQACPICGRPLEICVEYLGKQVVCDHCGGHFVAQDPENRSSMAAAEPDPMLRRADELLAISTQRLGPGRGNHLPTGIRRG
jgi:hypothetical protein